MKNNLPVVVQPHQRDEYQDLQTLVCYTNLECFPAADTN